ncbi:MAG: hypothetical protein IIT70_08400, partial [Clostridia bacterium]|nr:hypothetical protein [Clostridia bacterium]
EAIFEFPKVMGYVPLLTIVDGKECFSLIDDPSKIDLYLDPFLFGLLDKINDVRSLRDHTETLTEYSCYAETGQASFSFAYRMLVEAILAGDEAQAVEWARKADAGRPEISEQFGQKHTGTADQELIVLPTLMLEKGIPACLEALKKVRDANMKRLVKGEVAEKR